MSKNGVISDVSKTKNDLSLFLDWLSHTREIGVTSLASRTKIKLEEATKSLQEVECKLEDAREAAERGDCKEVLRILT